MNSPVQKIKERLSIEEVVSSYIKLEKSGANLKARCPFHNEKTPSFFVSPSRGSYYCFGCAAKGDIFTFIKEFEGLDFKGALKLLAGRAGVSLQNFNPEMESEKEKLYKIMEDATSYFVKNLEENEEILKYLKTRGLSIGTIKDFRIGFAKLDWRELYSYLIAKNWKEFELEKAGLIKKPASPSLGGTEKDLPVGRQGFYDRFRGRIIFPISDSSGRVIAFSGRIFVDDGKSAKYLNSPDTPIFSKSSVLYGLDRAKESIRKNNFSILVEGQMDLILSHQAGYKNTVASSGTALSDSTISRENVISNLGLVRRLSENIVLAFDGDKAGFNASTRAGKIALSLGMDVKVAALPPSVDPADLISKSGVPAWKKAIKNSKHLIEFFLDKILEDGTNDNRRIGREIKEKILPYVNAVESSIEKMHFLKKISDTTGIPEEALKDDLKKVEQELKFEQIAEEKVVPSQVFRKDYIEKRLLGIVLWQKTLLEQKIDAEKILKKIAEILNIEINMLLEKTANSKEDLIFEAEVFYGSDVDLKKDVKELLDNLEEEYLKEKLLRKIQELHFSEEKKEKERTGQILKEISEINNKIQSIKNGRK